MGYETRAIFHQLRRDAARRRYLAVYRERGFWVLVNLLTRSRRYYAHPRDVRTLLDRPADPFEE